MHVIQNSSDTLLQVIATNMHLSSKYGNTYREIENEGFAIDYKIPILSDEPNDDNAILHSMSCAITGFAEAFSVLNPDLIIVLGDRYEILAAVESALIKKIPVAHIHGGELTFGAYDDAIRHSITKMAQLHFTSTEEYRNRVIQLGENPDRVFNVGALGVENVLQSELMTKNDVEKSINFALDKQTVLITYHPVTLTHQSPTEAIDALLDALDERPNVRVVFTMPNSDNGGQVIADRIDEYVTLHPTKSCVFKSLGMKRYLSVMKYIGAVVGNSSSGIIEAPSFHVPTLNIGCRQEGRTCADSVHHCLPDKSSIIQGLDYVLSSEFSEVASNTHNPYEKGNTANEIFRVISTCQLDGLICKRFYDI